VKLDNIIYCPEDHSLKIIDLGFASSCRDPLKSFCGTPSYIAPEITIKRQQFAGDKADIWSTGVCLYVLLTGLFPFKAADEKQLYRRI